VSAARRSAAALVLAGLAATAACSLTVDLDSLRGGGAGSGSGGAGGEALSCEPKELPERPAGPTPGGDVGFVAAVRSIDLGEAATKESPVGLDVDKYCTCAGDGESCRSPVFATNDHCDSKDGVDNAASLIIRNLTAASSSKSFGSAYFTEKAEQGRWSLLLRVSGYNGAPDDDQVKVSVLTTPGIDVPTWSGADAWGVSMGSLLDGASLDAPKYVDESAYVAAGALVAQLPDLLIPLESPKSRISIRVTGATLTGTLDNPADGLGWRVIGGVIVGRWKATDVFASLSTHLSNEVPVCKDSFTYGPLKMAICGFIDILSAPGGATAECDALSFGMAFESFPAALGPVVADTPVPLSCPAEQDPASDGCG
jgi:hypothetical protein